MSGKDEWEDESTRQICCLIDQRRRCARLAGNAVYGNKNIQRIVQQRKLKLERDEYASHVYICDHHKEKIMSGRAVRRRRYSDEEESSPEPLEKKRKTELTIFSQLPVNTLRRYKKHFRLPSRPGHNKLQLAETITKHFKTLKVNEKEVLTYFIYSLKSRRSDRDSSPATSSKYRPMSSSI